MKHGNRSWFFVGDHLGMSLKSINISHEKGRSIEHHWHIRTEATENNARFKTSMLDTISLNCIIESKKQKSIVHIPWQKQSILNCVNLAWVVVHVSFWPSNEVFLVFFSSFCLWRVFFARFATKICRFPKLHQGWPGWPGCPLDSTPRSIRSNLLQIVKASHPTLNPKYGNMSYLSIL